MPVIAKYVYSIKQAFPDGNLQTGALQQSIVDAGLTTIAYIDTFDDSLVVYFTTTLSAQEKQTLDTTVFAQDQKPLMPLEVVHFIDSGSLVVPTQVRRVIRFGSFKPTEVTFANVLVDNTNDPQVESIAERFAIVFWKTLLPGDWSMEFDYGLVVKPG